MDSDERAEVRLAPKSLTAVYLPWLKVSVALRYALTFPCTRGVAGGSPESPLAPGRAERHPQGRTVHLTEIGYAYTCCFLGRLP
jgi:hypothetical protein